MIVKAPRAGLNSSSGHARPPGLSLPPSCFLSVFLVATGDRYWVFDAERQITGPDPVRRLGLPVSDIQAALGWQQDGVEKAYLLKSSSYWSLDPQESRLDDIYPRSTWEWEGVPGHVDAAFRDTHGESRSHAQAAGQGGALLTLLSRSAGYANVLSGLHYWRLDPADMKVLEGYPRSIAADFFGCASFLPK